MLTSSWTRYIAQYHETNAGITEVALEHARHPEHGVAYDWLARALQHRDGRVLDLACGSAPMHDRLGSTDYLGIDASPAELSAARASGRGPVELGDVTQLPAPDASVDRVVMSMALMLVPIEETLREIARVLRPGGLFAAIVPAAWPLTPADIRPIAALSVPLLGPGRLPQVVRTGPLARALIEAGLDPQSKSAVRFPFPITEPAHAELAVRALYTPGRSPMQRARAVRRLERLRRPVELPVPILRFTARRRCGAAIRS